MTESEGVGVIFFHTLNDQNLIYLNNISLSNIFILIFVGNNGYVWQSIYIKNIYIKNPLTNNYLIFPFSLTNLIILINLKFINKQKIKLQRNFISIENPKYIKLLNITLVNIIFLNKFL